VRHATRARRLGLEQGQDDGHRKRASGAKAAFYRASDGAKFTNAEGGGSAFGRCG
jgi:hypothetical protein